MGTASAGWHGITRRGFLLGTATGLAAGLPAAWLAARRFPHLFPNTLAHPLGSSPPEIPRSDRMPGRYPGRVIEIHDPHSVTPANKISASAVGRMVDRGMGELTGVADPRDVRSAWRTFFERGDVVGVKVNPVGRRPMPGEQGRVPNAVGSISSPELLLKVVACLKEAGIPARDIIVFERYANEFKDAGYVDVMKTRPLDGVRWMASSAGYSELQLDITGLDGGRDRYPPELARHVAGYDPDVFTVMGFCLPQHSPNDDRRFRSHLSMIVSRLINKMVTLPVLKDHRSAGVTLALKNMSHGMNNNVSRSHLSGIAHGVGPEARVLGPNQCNTFIPQAVSQQRLREKATLHILDGLIGVYEGGPGCWNRTWGTWRHKSLFFATDPVALDHVGWDVINAKRAELGWAPVERMGWLYQTPAGQAASSLAPLAAAGPLPAATLQAGALNILEGRTSEAFNVRQPDHVTLAGQLGLGVFDRSQIAYRRITLSEPEA
jgi:hypothetical protein